MMARVLFVFPQWHFNIFDQLDCFSKELDITTLNFKSADEIFFLGGKGELRIKALNLKLWKVLRFMSSEFYFPNLADFWKNVTRDYDLVVFKNIYCPTSLIGFAICRLKGIRFSFSEQNIREPSGFAGLLFWMVKNIYLKWIIHLRNVSCYANTRTAYGQLKEYSGNAAYIPFAIYPKETTKNFKMKLKSGNNILRVLNISKFQYRKDQETLLHALEELQAENPGMKIELTLIGGIMKNPDYCLKMKKLARSSNIRVSILKEVKRKDLGKLYLSHDLFVLPSYDEPAAYSHLEAMSYGLPVICSDENGTKEYIRTGYNGSVFKSRDIPSLKKSIKEMCLSKNKVDWEKMARLGKGSDTLVRKNHDPQVILRSFRRLYRI
jgi:glycosyltransferase involved in cell wall biosynthesis